MAEVFPTSRFGFTAQEVDIEAQVLDGGETLAGGTDTIATDGGGRVFAEFGDGNLVDRDTVLAWRAILTMLDGGITAMVVPFCDSRHQPYGGGHSVTYGDATTHSDGTLFSGGGPQAEATAPAALRATTLSFVGVFQRPIIGGEWFAIEHPTKGWRAYRVRTINADAGTLTFRPPLREALAGGELLDFSNPRCLMRQQGRASSALANRRQTTAAIRFVET